LKVTDRGASHNGILEKILSKQTFAIFASRKTQPFAGVQKIISFKVFGPAQREDGYNIHVHRDGFLALGRGPSELGLRFDGGTSMLRKSVTAMIALMLAASLAAAQDKGKEGKKDAKEIKGKVVKVDMVKKTITVTLENGKKQDLKIDDDTKFVGPRGGVSDDKLKDDRLAVGAEITFVMGAPGKGVKEIRLPMRKGKDADKKAPDKKGNDK
jgi:hypothetical protein